MKESETYFTQIKEETEEIGRQVGARLAGGAVLAFYGDLGAGKTTFIRGLVEGAGCANIREVCSPTFSYLNIYQANCAIYHFDLYRLKTVEEFYAAGFDEYFHPQGICCVEWAEKIESALPGNVCRVTLSYLGAEKRKIEIMSERV